MRTANFKSAAIAALLSMGLLTGCTNGITNQKTSNHMDTLNLTQEWDKKFPQSNKVNHRKVTFKNRYGITLAADLYEPKNIESKVPAIAVSGPFGAVKEQSSGLYAQTMAECGFLTLAFDPSYTGESGGEPRNVASPDINTEDFSAAVDFLIAHPNVDAKRIGIIGICGFGGMTECRGNGHAHQSNSSFYNVRYEPRECQRLFRCRGQCRSTPQQTRGDECYPDP